MSDEINVSGTPSATPAAATPAAPAPSQAIHVTPAAPSATPMAPPAAAIPAAPQVEPSWLKGRLEETRQAALRQAAEAYQRREQDYNQQMQQYQRQLQALVGVNPPANPEVDNIRQQFGQVYPGLSKLEERAEQLMGIIEKSQELEAQNNHYWASHGRQTMNSLFKRAEESYGTPLNDAGRRQLHAAFTGYVSSSPELTYRYANDPTVVDEFWDNFTSSFIQPARRATAAAPEIRTPGALPSNAPSGAPQLSQAPQPQGLDQRAAMGWAALQHSRNQG